MHKKTLQPSIACAHPIPPSPFQCSQSRGPSVLSQDGDGQQLAAPSGHFKSCLTRRNQRRGRTTFCYPVSSVLELAPRVQVKDSPPQFPAIFRCFPSSPAVLHQENGFRWTKVVLNATGPPPRTMVLLVPLVHSWSTLILPGPLRVTTLRKLRTKVDQGGPGGPWKPWSWLLDQEHCVPVFTFC